MDKFATQTTSIAYLYDLKKRKRIKYDDTVKRTKWNKWGKNQRQSFIEYLKKDFPVRPILCYTKMEESELIYYISDGFNRIRAIMKYLNKTMDQDLMNKLLVLEIVPSNISESDLNQIYQVLGGG